MRKETGIQPRPVESEVWVRATVYVTARGGGGNTGKGEGVRKMNMETRPHWR